MPLIPDPRTPCTPLHPAPRFQAHSDRVVRKAAGKPKRSTAGAHNISLKVSLGENGFTSRFQQKFGLSIGPAQPPPLSAPQTTLTRATPQARAPVCPPICPDRGKPCCHVTSHLRCGRCTARASPLRAGTLSAWRPSTPPLLTAW